MVKESNHQDRNFDELARRFQKNIYGGLKGAIRLAVLERDFNEFYKYSPFNAAKNAPGKTLRILDAGGGQGQFSLHFAKAGHDVVICDISSEMLKLAQAEISAQQLDKKVRLIHSSIQDLSQHLEGNDCHFDVILCHAVIEWVVNPPEILDVLIDYLKPEGYLSLTFYNLHALIYKNLLRTNFKKIQQQDFTGSRGSLTPINPLYPKQVLSWVNALPLEILTTSGIRVFHDYIFDQEKRERDQDSVIELELAFSRQQPYQLLGRYIHILARKC